VSSFADAAMAVSLSITSGGAPTCGESKPGFILPVRKKPEVGEKHVYRISRKFFQIRRFPFG
jgi:hypothetical protein